MSKKLAGSVLVPFLVLSLAALTEIGCSSSSNSGGTGGKVTDGGSGTGGTVVGTGGHTGTGGNSDASAGTGGNSDASAGTGGNSDASTGTGGNSDASTGTGGASDAASDAPTDSPVTGDGSSDASTIPACSVTIDTVDGAATTEKLTAEAFCANFLSAPGCIGLEGDGGYSIPAGYASMAECVASYNASTQQHCQSYHLCGNALDKPLANKLVHCPHASGAGHCAPVADASTGQ